MDHEHDHHSPLSNEAGGLRREWRCPARGGAHHAALDRHEGHSVAMFRDKCWLSLALTIPV